MAAGRRDRGVARRYGHRLGAAGMAARGTAGCPCWESAGRRRGIQLRDRGGATVRYTARAWGTQLEVHVTGILSGIICRFWVTTSHGQDIAAGGWAIAAGQQHTWYPASTPVPVSGLRSFEVTSVGKTLATVLAHPRPPRHAPTRSR